MAMQPNWHAEEADAEAAYNQSKHKGPPLHIRLPKVLQPKSWQGKFRDPVTLLGMNLYGHPTAGNTWGDDCHGRLSKCNFYLVCEEFPGLYLHKTFHQIVLVVYVDDFRMAGTPEHLDACWKLVSGCITIDKPQRALRMLGINTREFTRTTSTINPTSTSIEVRLKQWEVKDFMISCIAKYKEVSGIPTTTILPKVGTPFLNESTFTDAGFNTPGVLATNLLHGTRGKMGSSKDLHLPCRLRV